MGKIVEKKKKKKGRPSLLDLQKRNLREQHELQQLQKRQHKKIPHHNNHSNNSTSHSRDNYATATPTRRSARRNPNPGDDSPEIPGTEEYDDEDDELAGKRREKKLKLVLRLPPNQNPDASLDSGGDDSNADEDTAAVNGNKKRKINAISDGSGNKADKSISGTNQSNAFQESAKLDSGSGPSTPLPDKKLLVFIIDRLQKKDTYGVFSDPVDPEELPDYNDVIENPMDFGTLRKKLSSGAYANLEQFERDVFLICSNAMQYNAPETIYFRQARSIHELAKKNFENLRQDSDDNEPEPKIVRRGRPPTKNLKKPIGRPSLEGLGPEISCDTATLASGVDNVPFSNHDLRKSYNNLSDKSSVAAESSGRLHGLRNYDLYSNWLADNKFDRSDELTGSLMRSIIKNGKKQVVHEESRRNTYIQPHQSVGVREPSVLMTFDAERKQLMPVGVLVEHGYARSLARFAANLGPVAWKVASKKIERSLPTGTKFGPGWVGENDLPKSKMPQYISNSPTSSHIQTSSVTANTKPEILPETPVIENLSDKKAPPSSSSGPTLTNKSPEPITPKPEPLEASNPQFPVLNSSVAGTRPKSPFPAHKWPMIHPGVNGFNGFNLSGLAKPPGFKDPSSHTVAKSSRTNTNNNYNTNININNDNGKVIETANALKPEETNKVIENRGTRSSLPYRPPPPLPGFQPQLTWQGQDSGLSPQKKPDLVPPDLNVGFQSPGSPSSSRVDSTQPDLALQL